MTSPLLETLTIETAQRQEDAVMPRASERGCSMAKRPKKIRPTILDTLDTGTVRSIWCKLDDLINEAAVEQFFVSRLLSDGLSYSDSQIKPKTSLSALTVAKGHKKIRYKPDYALTVNDVPRCIVDAKAPDQSLDDWIEQCSGYCLALNRRFEATNPVRFFLLSNGKQTRLYAWDKDDPILTLDFADFTWGSTKYEQLCSIIAADKIVAASESVSPPEPVSERKFSLVRPTPERAKQLFAICHNVIRKSEVGGPFFAFMEFIKIMFVKMWEDKKLRRGSETSQHFASGQDEAVLPQSAMIFSLHWIEAREKEGTQNPVDTILFSRLRDDIERSIELREKKRLFELNETIRLRPNTIKELVRRLEHFDMYGIDEDLNGRLFETFLSATMRGRDLGQFFTPRSIVKMMTRLANLRVDSEHQDKVIDGCCGSGGFLIEALTVMREKITKNTSLSLEEKTDLLETVCNECLFGVDYAKEPPLARIARINMYLHGDGGSRIYYADGLDKKLDTTKEKEPEVIQNMRELRETLEQPTLFDAVLTNPPFSMTKSKNNETELQILVQYDLARRKPESTRLRASLRCSVMFFERYADLLRPGGVLLTVIDETILAGPEYAFVRDYIRQKFLIRAIISLPGDAFQQSGSRIKTSVLLLEKKKQPTDVQPSCFTFFSIRLGVDDLAPKASESRVLEARSLAAAEIEEIVKGYKAYRRGHGGVNVLPAENLKGSLDLKSCAPLLGRMVPVWENQGLEVKRLDECMTPAGETINPKDYPDQKFSLIRVGYDGRCKVDSVRKGSAIKYPDMMKVKSGQLVFSIIRAVNGAIGIVPEELDGALVSHSFNVFNGDSPEDTAYLWSLLRSHEIRADIQSAATGASRYYAHWDAIKGIKIPWLADAERKAIGKQYLDIWAMEKQLKAERKKAVDMLIPLDVESDESVRRWEASKPPR